MKGGSNVTTDRQFSLQTKRAMYRAALAAQFAGEPYVGGDRIAGSLLRTDAVRQFCSRAQIDTAQILEALGDAEGPSFEECERRVQEQASALQLRPIDPALKPAFEAIMRRYGQLAVSPLALLLEVMCAHSAVAIRLAAHGLTPEAIRAEIGREKE